PADRNESRTARACHRALWFRARCSSLAIERVCALNNRTPLGVIRADGNDAEVERIFDKVEHGWMVKFVEHRIGDQRIVRLIQKWLKAGVMEGGQWFETEEGTPQGAVMTPRTQKVTWARP